MPDIDGDRVTLLIDIIGLRALAQLVISPLCFLNSLPCTKCVMYSLDLVLRKLFCLLDGTRVLLWLSSFCDYWLDMPEIRSTDLYTS
jgi:hypothetical protein